ncbi:MAG: CHRD domain-containing protein [Acidobacteria bacterium]|nr:CHRD domain-containing protein [Acidobacteriota bacterium]
MVASKWWSLPLALIAGLTLTAQSSRTYKARLSPVALDIAMQATISGAGSVSAVLTGTKLTITGTFDGLKSPATIAQIHKGPVKGMRGPSIFDLTVAPGTTATSGTISGAVTLTPVQVTDLEKGRLYVQVHSEKAPDGNLWGWLLAQENRR